MKPKRGVHNRSLEIRGAQLAAILGKLLAMAQAVSSSETARWLWRSLLLLILLVLLTTIWLSEHSAALSSHTNAYVPTGPFDLFITPPLDAYFELPFWTVPGGMRQLTISTSYSYKCYTPLNPLTDTIELSSTQCILATRDFVHKCNSEAEEWGRNYNGILSQHPISVGGGTRLIAFGQGENKNEFLDENYCGRGSQCYQNTVNAEVACDECASGWHDDVYSDCWEAYNAFVNLSWQYFDEEHEWGMQPHVETGPILWPSNGYTYGGQKSSEGIRHPHGFVDHDYIWVFYEDKSYANGSRGYGIKVARAPVNTGGLPRNWQSYCDGDWVDSLPAGFDVDTIASFYPQRGGCASPILDAGGWQDSFAVARDEKGEYWGIGEHHMPELWELRLWHSSDLIHWAFYQTLLSVAGGWNNGELHYPVFLSADGWHSDQIHSNDFYIVGTKNGIVRAINVYTTVPGSFIYLPLVTR